ncbi:MAG: helix-turn-helix domain-containing protein [Gammaproteobacteria bacterium]
MTTLDLFFRFSAVALLMVISLILVRDYRDKPAAWLASGWAVSGICYLLVGAAFRDLGWSVYLLLAGAITGPPLFWLLMRSLFEDRFQLGWRHLLIIMTIVARSMGSLIGGSVELSEGSTIYDQSPFAVVLPQSLSFVFYGWGMIVALKDWRGDLVEARRRIRLALLLGAGSYAIVLGVVTLSVSFRLTTVSVVVLDVINAAMHFVLCLSFSASMLSLRSDFLEGPVPRAVSVEVPEEELSPVITNLTRAMQEEKRYCEHGLTIGRLAASLGIKEYKLRRIINGRFGYRNFNEFLNRYRIEEASRRLIAPETKGLPVLTIAIEVGYQSLGPFNRAFKEIQGKTPTEFRRIAVVQGAGAAEPVA